MGESLYKREYEGFGMALLAAVFWGVSGTCAQFLFEQRDINPEWLVAIRLLSSGLILLLLATVRKESIFSIWKVKRQAFQLIVFALFGMLAVQYTYFVTIKYSNAATATVLQYTGPVLIMIYFSVRRGTVPNGLEFLALVLAVTGTFLLVTHGNFNHLSVSVPAIVWGVGSAIALAFYSIQPAHLLQRHSSTLVIGWGMLIGGIAISFIHPPWDFPGKWDMATCLNICFVILCGTLVAFCLYMLSVKAVGAQNASLLASAEPLSAAVISVLWLGVDFGLVEWLGSILIIFTVFLIATNTRKARGEVPAPEGAVFVSAEGKQR